MSSKQPPRFQAQKVEPPSLKSNAGHEEKESEAVLRISFLSRFAMGDSPLALLASFLMLLVAVAIALALRMQDYYDDDPSTRAARSLGPVPKIDPPRIYHVSNDETLSDEIRQAYEKDGVVAVRGLLSEAQLHKLELGAAALVKDQMEADRKRKRKRSSTQFYTVRVGPVFLSAPSHDNKGDAVDFPASSFREIALFSAIPKFAADLMQLREDQNDTLRLLRDIFLVKDEEQYICGWHVDDTGFWPATSESDGVNAWIAIDDMPLEGGGGFALAVGSHTAKWREEAYRVTGATPTNPPEGFKDAADMFANRTGSGTCNLKTAAPHLHQRMEDTKRIYDLKRGDVIFHTRWLFHRTVSFTPDHLESVGRDQLYRRYSIRYGPGSAVIPLGYCTELSVLWNEENAGRSADAVALLDGPWYPQCWPTVKSQEMEQLQALIETKMPIAEERRQARRKEMQPYLSKLARTQNKENLAAYRSQH